MLRFFPEQGVMGIFKQEIWEHKYARKLYEIFFSIVYGAYVKP